MAKHEQQTAKSKMDCKLMVDCSHANSQKLRTNQLIVSADVGGQVAKGNMNIIDVMVESKLAAGAKKAPRGKPLVNRQSVAGAFVNWDTTVDMLTKLAADVGANRLQ